jgi:hypothetical protein
MGAVIYMHKVQVDDNNPAIVPSLAEVLAEFEDIFQEPKDLPPDIFQEPKDLPPAKLSTLDLTDYHLRKRTHWSP